jgi:hypothetical protein
MTPMARDTQSRWRLRAREIIAAALAALPKEATDADRRRALRDACPWRRERAGDGCSHPYKMWLKERRLALGPAARGGRVTNRTEAMPNLIRLTLFYPDPDSAGVWCGGAPPATGCIMCGVARREWAAGASDVARKYRADSHPLIIADELDERGHEESARLIRLELNRPRSDA